MDINDELCCKFISNPTVHPDNPNKRLIKGKGPYNNYISLCRQYGFNVDKFSLKLEINIPKPLAINNNSENDIIPAGFTKIKDIDHQILIRLDDINLTNICLVNKYINSLINDNNFWILRIDKNYPGFPIPLKYKNKEKELYLELYDFLLDNHKLDEEYTVEWAIELENLNILKWLAITYNYYPNKGQINLIAREKISDILEWLMEKKTFPTEDGANFAAENGYIEMLDSLAKNDVYPNMDGIKLAIIKGNIYTLEWAYRIRDNYIEDHDDIYDDSYDNDYYPIYDIDDDYIMKEASYCGNIKILEWLKLRGIFPNVNGANLAAGNGHIYILKWMMDFNIYPDVNGDNFAAENGHYNILKWMLKFNIYPNVNGANLAAGNGHIDILKWLAKYKIYPNTDGANYAVDKGNIDILEWLVEHNIYPDVKAANRTASGYGYFIFPIGDALESIDGTKKYIEMLEWLFKNNICPNTVGANEAAKFGHIYNLKLLMQNGVYPNQEAVNKVADNENFNILRLMMQNGIYPNQEAVNKAVAYGKLNLLKVLMQNGIYPNQETVNRSKKYGRRPDILKLMAYYNIYPDKKVS